MVGHCSSFSPSYNKVARCREVVQHPCMHVWSMANASLGNIHLFLCFLCHPYILTDFVENFYSSLVNNCNTWSLFDMAESVKEVFVSVVSNALNRNQASSSAPSANQEQSFCTGAEKVGSSRMCKFHSSHWPMKL